MRRGFVFFLWLFLLVFVIASFYISFTAYLKDRDRKILTNIGEFLIKANQGKSNIALPYPDQTVLVYLRKPEGKFMSANALSNIDRSKFELVSVIAEGNTVYVYVKKVDPVEYLLFVGQNRFYTGLLVASFLLYISIFYFTLREFELNRGGELTEELINKLKALRLTLATLKVIPEESVEEMKKVVDGILRHKVSKR